MTVAVIVGSEGQDGRLLFDRLVRDGAEVIGIGRRSVRTSNGVSHDPIDVTDHEMVTSLLADVNPQMIYYLAAVHGSSQAAEGSGEADLFARSSRVHLDGVVNCLDWISDYAACSLFYAASSLIFGEPADRPQNELTPLRPNSAYGITKAAGLSACSYYRDRKGVNASSGILYNHESPLRGSSFVSQKIATAAANIARGNADVLMLGNLEARVDWGYAPDYVDAMVRIAALDSGDDFVIATGETHSVRDFVELAFARVDLDWRMHVREDASLLTRRDTLRVGDSSRLRTLTGWGPTVSFAEMVNIMVDAAMERQS